eukprot:scaffold4212_cov122-Isochrysis_galbana.AAC.9
MLTQRLEPAIGGGGRVRIARRTSEFRGVSGGPRQGIKVGRRQAGKTISGGARQCPESESSTVAWPSDHAAGRGTTDAGKHSAEDPAEEEPGREARVAFALTAHAIGRLLSARTSEAEAVGAAAAAGAAAGMVVGSSMEAAASAAAASRTTACARIGALATGNARWVGGPAASVAPPYASSKPTARRSATPDAKRPSRSWKEVLPRRIVL